MPPKPSEHHENEDSDTVEAVGELHHGVSELAFSPRLSSFLQQLGRADLVDKFTEFGVSDAWLPLSKNVVRHLMRGPSEVNSFLEFQSGFLLSEWPEDFSKKHMSFEDECHPFETERELGVGGFGTVELVKDPITSRTYAMKVVPRPRNPKDHFKAMKTLSKEIAIMKQVKHHHCVELCASWTDFDSVSFLCSPVAEMDLEAFMMLDYRGGERNTFLRHAVGCLCTALKYLHDHKIRHEDIKPRNILVYKSTVLLTDFGLSHDFSYLSNSTTTGVPAGLTMRYAAPEAMSHDPRNRSSDVWELGCVLIEMLSYLRGYNLHEAKEFWKKNHALSFEDMHITARWCDMLRSPSYPEYPSSIEQQGTAHKDMALLTFVEAHMLQIESPLRPSIDQVCERLKDMDFSYPLGSITSWFGSCCRDLAIDYNRINLSANPYNWADFNEYLIAVDFGTTFSGLAWAAASEPPTVHVITQWPSGRTDEKIPTTVSYEENGDILWSSKIPHRLPKHELFKLGLEPSTYNESRLATKYPSFVTAQSDVRDSEKLVIDYLSELRKHAETELDAALVRAKIIDKRRKSIKYIITIPAIWTDKAKDTMRTLASMAGMGDKPESVQVVTEPEAAAMHELTERTKPGKTPDLEANDTFIICDAGGGTVDLISYTITQLYPHPVVRETTSGSGGKCGSTFLNRIFADWLRRHLGNEPEWHEDVLSRAVDDFDRVKTTFQQTSGRSQQHYVIQIPRFWELPQKKITRGTLRLTHQDMEGIFRPVVREVIALVKDQIAATGHTAKTVILVGGFGQSVHLRETLQRAVGQDVQVKKSMDPLCAVVKGAALYGLQYSSHRTHFRIESRKARKHYGTEALDSYDPTKHDRRRQVIDGFTGDTKAWVMKWFMHKEEPVMSSKPKRIPFYYARKVSDGRPQKVSVKIFCSQSETAPLHRDDQVSELVEVTADLTRIPDHDFNREIGSNNQEYYKLDFDIEMKCESATTEYRLVYNGKKYDVVRAEYA